MELEEISRILDEYASGFVSALCERGKLSHEDFSEGSFISGNTVRAFRRKRSELSDDETLVSKIIDSLTSQTARTSLEDILREVDPKTRLNSKLELADTELSWLDKVGAKEKERLKKVKVIDLALKEFVFCLDGGAERFKNTDTALDYMTLRPFANQDIAGESLGRNPRMGNVVSNEMYLEIQAEIRGRFDNGWVYDFVTWNLTRTAGLK